MAVFHDAPEEGVDLPAPARAPARVRGRTWRLTVSAVVLALLAVGSLWGSDDDFPFGPFRMYAGVNGPDEDAPDLRVEAVDASGAVRHLDSASTGVRRAEIEGGQQRYVAEPARLGDLAEAYRIRHPSAPALVRVRLVVRWHHVRDSRPTGGYRDETIAVWEAP